MFGWEWKSGEMKKKILNKFIHISLLNNNAQLKKNVTNNQKKKKQSPKFIKKIKIMSQKKKKKSNWMKPSPCALARGQFCQSRKNASPPSFLPILGRKHFGGPRDKTPRTHPFFSLPSLKPNTYQKCSLFFFFLFYSP